MRAAGVKVLTVKDILSFGVAEHLGARCELEELASKALCYDIAEGHKADEFSEKVKSLFLLFDLFFRNAKLMSSLRTPLAYYALTYVKPVAFYEFSLPMTDAHNLVIITLLQWSQCLKFRSFDNTTVWLKNRGICTDHLCSSLQAMASRHTVHNHAGGREYKYVFAVQIPASKLQLAPWQFVCP